MSYYEADERVNARCLRAITEYWVRRGLDPEVWEEVSYVMIDGMQHVRGKVLRSNMINGKPRA